MRLGSADLQRLSTLLDRALELPQAERETWLASLQGDALALAPMLRELLAKHARHETGDLIDRLPAFTVAPEPAAASALAAGDTVGPYRLLRELGHGGMGEVWLAERTDGQIKRPVALKLPMLGARRSVLVQRFARERDILGALAHPHIARLYDAGLADDGQPYLALEYVEGQPITAYCDEHDLDASARIALLRQVMAAVQFAHANLVIHRDLKPSNVLVTREGQAMLLDFGIAKLLQDERAQADETELTQFGGRALTPAYAAPEQITGAAVSIATDVYALGVLLYELLAGQRPFAASTRAALEQTVLTEEPQRPSQHKASPIAALPQGLQADLDTIALKALKKAPAERYATVNALLEDLERFERGQPVLAQPDSRWYRLRKFVARHRVPVVAGALVAAAMVVVSAVAVWQARVASEQSTLAKQQADAATKEAHRATAVQDFLLEIFQANRIEKKDPVKAQQTTARELLDLGATRINDALKDVPETRIQLLATLSTLYFQLGLREQSRRLQREATDLARDTFGPKDPRFARMAIEAANRLVESTERQDARALLEQADRALEASGQTNSIEHANLLFELSAYYRYESLASALRAASKSVAIFEQRDPNNARLVDAYRMLGRLRVISGTYAEGERLFRAAVATAEKQGIAARQINGLAELSEALLFNLSLAEAEHYGRESVRLSDQAYGPDHRWTLIVRIRLANMLSYLGRVAEADALRHEVTRALATQRPEYDAQFRADMASYLAAPLLRQGRPDLYEPLIRQDVDDLVRHFPRSAAAARRESQLAEAWIVMGRYDDASALLQRATERWQRFAAGVKASSVEYDLVAASLLIATGRLQEAAARLDASFETSGANDTMTSDSRWRWHARRAQVALALGDAAAALRGAESALNDMHARMKAARPAATEADLLLVRGLSRQALGDLRGAETDLQAALELRRQHDDPSSLWLAQAQIALAECLIAQKRFVQAGPLLDAAQRIHLQHRPVAPHLAGPLTRTRRALPA